MIHEWTHLSAYTKIRCCMIHIIMIANETTFHPKDTDDVEVSNCRS